MKNLSEFFEEQMPGYDQEQVKKVLEIYRDFKRENQLQYCHLCGKRFTKEEKESIIKDINAFQVLCFEHQQYKQWYNSAAIEKVSGLKFLDPFDI